MPKVSMIRSLFVCVIAILTAACADAPTTASTPMPARGTPAKIEISATPGTGANGGTATVTARVLDAYAAVVADVDVAFAADAGTFAAATVKTDQSGLAIAALTASPGLVKVTASAGSLRATEVPVEIQPQTSTSTPPPSVPPPGTPGPADIPLTATLFVTPGAAGSPTSFSVATGPITSAVWTFGDGASTTTTITPTSGPGTTTHNYAVGSYIASVTVTDARGRQASDSKPVTITIALPASYTVALSASPVVAGGSSTLTATVTQVNGAPAVSAWAWDCDNNGTVDATSANTASCTYPTEGTFAARVTVTGGTLTGTATTVVTVSPKTPTVTVHCAQPTPPALTVNCNVSATLDGATVATSDITHVDWDWADTATSASANALGTHTYAAANTYVITARNVSVNGTTAKGTNSASVVVQ
jgi:PKD repeat protein